MRPLRRRARARQSPEAFCALLGHRLFDLRRQTGTHLRLEPVDQENAGGVSVSTAARAIVVLRRARLRRPTGVGEVADAAQDVGEDRLSAGGWWRPSPRRDPHA